MMNRNIYSNSDSQNTQSLEDLPTQELLQDAFKNYYFQGNEGVREDIDHSFHAYENKYEVLY